MNPIRKSRLRTHGKRKKKLIRAGKAAAFWYMSVLAAITLVSPTLAGFTSSQEIEGTIEAGKWPVPWKQTEVSLTVENDEVDSCDPIELKAKFINKGKYETEKGYWKIEGEAEGPHEVGKMKPGESVEFAFKASGPGSYTFKAYQEGKHPSEFLKTITVACEKEEADEEEETLPEESKDEEKSNKEGNEDNKPENNDKKDTEQSNPGEPQKPAENQPENSIPPANEDKPKPEPKPAPAPVPNPEPSPAPEPPAVKEEPENSNSVKDGEE